MQLHHAIEKGWYWSISETKPKEIAWISKGNKCLVKLVDGKIEDIEPRLSSFDTNIIKTIMSTNLGYD